MIDENVNQKMIWLNGRICKEKLIRDQFISVKFFIQWVHHWWFIRKKLLFMVKIVIWKKKTILLTKRKDCLCSQKCAPSITATSSSITDQSSDTRKMQLSNGLSPLIVWNKLHLHWAVPPSDIIIRSFCNFLPVKCLHWIVHFSILVACPFEWHVPICKPIYLFIMSDNWHFKLTIPLSDTLRWNSFHVSLLN